MKKLVLLLVLCGLVACAHKRPVPEAAPPTPPPAPAAPAPAEPAPTPVEPQVVTPVTDTAAQEALSYTLEELNRKGYLKDVYFDYDQSDIKSEFRDGLEQNAQFLSRNSSVRIMVEGHCDERGTREYNIALGTRRAEAVKSYLGALGIDAGRLQTISYGREKPFADCHDDSCWSQNRRAHFVIIAK
jgi:peptidoglycan-associated lipoprotein